jgi:hypothetical protein
MVTAGLTIKGKPETEPEEGPDAPIVCEPEAEAGTVKVPLQLPEELAEIAEETVVPS